MRPELREKLHPVRRWLEKFMKDESALGTKLWVITTSSHATLLHFLFFGPTFVETALSEKAVL